MTTAPAYPHDLFTDDVLASPYRHCSALRELGPVVWPAAREMYAITRYAEAKAALADPGTYCSGHGVALNGAANGIAVGRNLLIGRVPVTVRPARPSMDTGVTE